MNFALRSRRSLCLVACLWVGVASAATDATAPADDGKPTLRGLLTLSDRVLFCIQLPERGQTAWVSPGRPAEGVVVVAHSVMSETVTIQYRGRTHVLALPTAKVRPAAGSPARESDGTDLVPPGRIRDAIRNRSLSPEQIKIWAHTPWFHDFARKHPEALPPVIR